MTNSVVQIIFALAAWAAVWVHSSSMRWEDARKVNGAAVKAWLATIFLAIAITGLLDFANSLDAYTINNFSRFVTYSAFLLSINLGVTAAFDAVGKDIDRPIIRRLWLLLVVALVIQAIIYILFLFRSLEFSYYETPRNLPEATCKLIVLCFEAMQGFIISKIFLTYLPDETSAVARIRVRMILLCSFAIGIFWLVMGINIAGYFWPVLISPMLISFSPLVLACVFILFFVAFLNNRFYAHFALLLRSPEYWRTYQDIKHLVERLMLLCPVIGLPPGNPSFFKFLLNPEYYLYRAIIIILDSKVMLADFVTESLRPDRHPLWEGDLFEEAIRINAALQSANPSNDFSDIVEAYRHVSRTLFVNQI